MNIPSFPRLLFFGLSFLAACSAEGSKVGTTVKGERIAVMEPAPAAEPDKGLEGVKPVLPEAVANASWPQAGFSARHIMPHARLAAHPQIVWKASIGHGSDSEVKLLAQPVADQKRVYTMDARGLVSAFDVKTGQARWERDTSPKDSDTVAMGGGIAVEGDTLYATTGFGEVLALNSENGAVRWRKALQKPLRAAPTVAGDRVYVVSIDNDLNTLNAATGEVLWHQAGIAEIATLLGASSPAVEDDTLVVAYSSGEIYGLRVQNGRVSWNYALASATQVGALPALAVIRGLPVIDHGRVFAVSHSGRIASIDQRTGGRIWENDIGGIDTPVVSGDALFVYGGSGALMALASDTGRSLWVTPLPKHLGDKGSDSVVWAGPVLASDRLWMVNSAGTLTSFSVDDGAQDVVMDLDQPLYVAPIVAGETLYVVTDKGKLIALR